MTAVWNKLCRLVVQISAGRDEYFTRSSGESVKQFAKAVVVVPAKGQFGVVIEFYEVVPAKEWV